MGPEIAWLLRNVWPKDTPNLTETSLASVDDDEARRLVNEVESVKRGVRALLVEDVARTSPCHATRVGVVERSGCSTSGHSMNTDYLMLISGVLAGNGGCSRWWSGATRSPRWTSSAGTRVPGLDLSRPAG